MPSVSLRFPIPTTMKNFSVLRKHFREDFYEFFCLIQYFTFLPRKNKYFFYLYHLEKIYVLALMDKKTAPSLYILYIFLIRETTTFLSNPQAILNEISINFHYISRHKTQKNNSFLSKSTILSICIHFFTFHPKFIPAIFSNKKRRHFCRPFYRG